MATKKKSTTEAEPKKLMKAIKGQPRTYTDGSPYVPSAIVRRPTSEIIAELQDKRVSALARHAKELATIDGKIAYHSNRGGAGGPSAEDTAKELLGEGMTKDQIDALIAKLQRGKKALKDKTPEEVEALRLEAVAAKQAPVDEPSEGEGVIVEPVPDVPSFLA